MYSFLKLLTRIFYDVHFFWSTSVDFGYIEEVRPDFIITEIAERFVKRFPDDQLDLRAFASERCAAFMQSCPSLSALITDDIG
jgi:alginate O-acetyltransferase complex protein AlgJ